MPPDRPLTDAPSSWRRKRNSVCSVARPSSARRLTKRLPVTTSSSAATLPQVLPECFGPVEAGGFADLVVRNPASLNEAGLLQHTHGATRLAQSGREDGPPIPRGERFAQKLANGGRREAASRPSRRDLWIADDRVARQPKRLGRYIPGFGHLGAKRPPEGRRIVDRGVEQGQTGGHEVDERSRQIEAVSPRVPGSGSA